MSFDRDESRNDFTWWCDGTVKSLKESQAYFSLALEIAFLKFQPPSQHYTSKIERIRIWNIVPLAPPSRCQKTQSFKVQGPKSILPVHIYRHFVNKCCEDELMMWFGSSCCLSRTHTDNLRTMRRKATDSNPKDHSWNSLAGWIARRRGECDVPFWYGINKEFYEGVVHPQDAVRWVDFM